MLYCDACRSKYVYPPIVALVHAECEDCGRVGTCFEPAELTHYGFQLPGVEFMAKAVTSPDYTILAAGPVFGGNATRPYRFVVVFWSNGEYSLHTESVDDIGGLSSGHYLGTGPKSYQWALNRWKMRIERELLERAECLVVPEQEK